MAGPIRISVLADTKDLQMNLGEAEASLKGMEDTAERSARGVDQAMDGVAEGADHVASKGAQAAGALTGLGGLAADQLGFPALGKSMMTAGIAMQALGDAGDLLNVVTESAIVKNIALKAQTIATAAAQKTAAAAQWALNAAMSANPIGLIVIAVAALVAGMVVAYKKSETFRDIVNGAFGAVKRVAQSVADFFTTKIPAAFDAVRAGASKAMGWVKEHWPEIVAVITGPIGVAVLLIAKNWDKIKAGAAAVKDFVVGKLGAIADFITGLPGRISRAASGMFDGISRAARGAFNLVIDAWNSLDFGINVTVPGWVPGIGGKSFGVADIFPDVPRLAAGGITTGPMLAMVGDNPGGREAIIPLDRYDLGNTRLVELLTKLISTVELQTRRQEAHAATTATAVERGQVESAKAFGRELRANVVAGSRGRA